MARYEILVKGSDAHDLSDWFQELQVQTAREDHRPLDEMLLTGDLPDQSALLGVLMRLHNLNLSILSVHLMAKEEGKNNAHHAN